MILAIRTKLWHPGVCVHRIHAIEDRRIDQPTPRLASLVILIVVVDPIPAFPVPEPEHELASRTTHKHGISTPLLVLPHHIVDPLESRHIQRFLRAEIDQRVDVHVSTQMNVTFSIERHRDAVVAVPL